MILVTGGNGQVGSEIKALASEYSLDFVFTDVEELDITDREKTQKFFDDNAISFVINCAAYTAVDKAEEFQDLAYSINVTGVQNLAHECNQRSTPLIHLSTDYVYHSNTQNVPFKEDDYTIPQSVYAATKLEGELLARRIHGLTMVIRTSWVYSSFGHNFVKTMLKLGADRDKLTVIFDQVGSPTYARDLAKAILDIIMYCENTDIDRFKFNETYHYSNEGVCSWYDFIFELHVFF